jgi:hypothetical protein
MDRWPEPALVSHRELLRVEQSTGSASLAWKSRACQSRQTHHQLGVAKDDRELDPEFLASLQLEHQRPQERRMDRSEQGPVYRRPVQHREQFRQVQESLAVLQVPLQTDHLREQELRGLALLVQVSLGQHQMDRLLREQAWQELGSREPAFQALEPELEQRALGSLVPG